ncbi:MAG: hypothetical protein F6K19_26560 [Cyanothece sp. SIO1E1]|nr:hypothetical protein [Cyanothece sp. SIO1E1]
MVSKKPPFLNGKFKKKKGGVRLDFMIGIFMVVLALLLEFTFCQRPDPWVLEYAPDIINDNSKPSEDIFSVKDSYGNEYSVKKMNDGKFWILENLKLDTKLVDVCCFDGLSNNCSEYGSLVGFEVAKEGCKSLGKGWRIPSQKDWRILIESYNGQKKAYKSLIEGGKSRFNAPLGGYWEQNNQGGIYKNREKSGWYWSSTLIKGENFRITQFLKEHGRVYEDTQSLRKLDRASCRCLVDTFQIAKTEKH